MLSQLEQVWPWLLGAFALGAVVAAVVMRMVGRRTPEPPPRVAPPPAPAEQTQVIPRPPDQYVEPDPGDSARGRRSGTLPTDWPPAS
jgi:hypothetical protein